MLIRVSLDVGTEEWFGIKLQMPSNPLTGLPETESGREEERKHLPDGRARQENASAEERSSGLHPIRALRRKYRCREERRFLRREQQLEKKRRKAEELERERLLAQWEEQIHKVEAAVKKLCVQVMELAEEERDCHYVYEDSVRKVLTAERGKNFGAADVERQNEMAGGTGVLPALWQRHFDLGEFDSYCSQFWVEQLMQQAVWPHFVILGTTPDLFWVLEKYARGMKSLRWVLLEADYTEELLAGVEDFYTEYGLAIALQPLEGMAAWKRFRFSCARPTNILDFTGESRIVISEVPEGSVWLDMLSVEEKRRRISGRNTSIQYISLKEKWKYAQRRCNSPVLP